MLKPYRTIQDVLASPWGKLQREQKQSQGQTDRVLRSTKLESSIYHDLRHDDSCMDEIEQSAGEKLKSFPALTQDVFQSFYSLMPRRNDEESLSVAARKFNAPILEHITQSEEYPTLKEVCEGRELPAYEAATEFVARASGELDDLLSQLGGKSGSLSTLEKLEQAEDKAANELVGLLEQLQRSQQDNPTLNEAVIKAANEAQSKHRQVEAVGKLIDASQMQNKASVSGIIQQAVAAATEKAEEVQSIIGAWIGLGAVCIHKQCDVRGTVGVVLNALYRCGNVILQSLEVDNTIFSAVTAADVSGRDSTQVVATAAVTLVVHQRSFGLCTRRQIIVSQNGYETTTCRRGFI